MAPRRGAFVLCLRYTIIMNHTYLPFIADALMDASKLATTSFGRVTNITKTDDNNQVLTETDLAIGKLLVAAVEEAYPAHNVIDEEAGCIDKQSDFTWVIDPIDGTSNFANAVPTYGVMIGLLRDGKAIAGGIACPSLGELYLGGIEAQATLNGEAIQVTTEARLLSCLVSYGVDGHQEAPEITHAEAVILEQLILNIRNLRTSNSCFDAGLVARGSYGAALNQSSKIWDNVAQQAIIEAAGGIYTDFWGEPMKYSNPISRANDNYTWCFGPSSLHKQIQELIHRRPTDIAQ